MGKLLESSRLFQGWLADTEKFSDFLEDVYSQNSGEIWLYNNDLSILTSNKYFNQLYKELIDGKLKNKIEAVKLLLNKELYQLFVQPNYSSKLFKNLQKLSKETLAKIYIGKIDDLIEQKILSDDVVKDEVALVFYTHDGELETDSGLVIVRHQKFPYVHREPGKFAVCWDIEKSRVLRDRLKSEFQSAFDFETNKTFQWLCLEDNSEITLKAGISSDTENLKKTNENSEKKGLSKRTADIGIIAALSLEFDAIVKKFKLNKVIGVSGVYTGVVSNEHNQNFDVALVQMPLMGNSHSACTTMQLRNRYDPKYIFLIGIAGGDKDKTNLGDVIYSTSVFAYEYQKITELKDGTKQIESYGISNPCSDNLIRVAHEVQKYWNYEIRVELKKSETKLDNDQEKNRNVKVISCKAKKGVIGSGSKVVADKEFLDKIINKPKELKAIEMEGEGVAIACKTNKECPFIVVKAISDFADGKSKGGGDTLEKEVLQELAAQASADFVYEMLMSGQIEL